MKTIYSLLLLCIGFSCFSQIVNIPDANFKNALINTTCATLLSNQNNVSSDVDTNNNGEIEVTEALDVRELWVENLNISSLNGIESFINIQQLRCSENSISSLDVSMLSNLNWLECSNNNLTSLVLSPSIGILICDHNQLSTIDLLPLTNLSGLGVAYNQLTSLVLPNMTFDEYGIDISGNLYTSVDLSTLHHTWSGVFVCQDTHLTSLTIPDIFLETYVSNNVDLTFLSLKNGTFDGCTPVPGDEDGPGYDCTNWYFNIYNNPNLQFVCVDGGEESFFEDFFANPNILVFSYCSFTPGGLYNTVTGTITYDMNNNGCTSSTTPAIAIPIQINQTQYTIGSTATNSNGNYTVYLGYSDTPTTIIPHVDSNYFTITPANFVPNFTGFGNTQTVNFCIAPNGVHPDLEVTIVPINAARPGFDAQYKIVYKNKGNQLQSGSVNFTFEDAILDFVSANPVFNSQTASTLSWGFTDLVPFETREILLTLNVNAPTETPSVNNGDILHYSVALTTAETDETPLDNQVTFNQIVVGSMDPNDKTCLEGNTINPSQVGNYLNYVIRFQNTGTYSAENVVVSDILNPKLDWNTLEMVSSSHPFRNTTSWSGKLEIFYENINLPASIDNEPASHGYIAFRIKPKNTVVLNDVIENTANIYFDYNFPIVTNTVATQVALLGSNNFSQSNFSLYPNPTKNILTIDFKNNDVIHSIAIYNTFGQLVQSISNDLYKKNFSLNVSPLHTGTYFITVITEAGKSTQKFIKL